MFLKYLYSEPAGLFEKVEFRNGMNIIYGKKEEGQPKNSLNSIGKSTLLDFLDFCLVSSPVKTHNPRLNATKKYSSGYTIVLEFEVDSKDFIIKRPIDDPRIIEISSGEITKTYKDKDLKIQLAKLIFQRKAYDGQFDPSWYRSLITFYLKIQKFKSEKFTDPIKYIRELSEVELNVYHFYLIGFNNNLSFENYKLNVDQKRLQPTINEITNFVSEKYSLNDLKETQNEINKLKVEIRKMEAAIAKFELGDQYQDAEEKANELTGKIKDFLYQNHLDREKIKAFGNSYETNEDVSTRRITRIFKELDEDFGKKVSKTIKEAIAFRKELSESRKEFLKAEIEKLNGFVKERGTKIDEFEKERAKLFYFLSAKEAITDLTEAFYNLSEKKNNLAELEGNTKILMDLTSELTQIETEINKLKTQSIEFLKDISEHLVEFFEIFSNIFNQLYLEQEGNSIFSITENFKKKSILEISVAMPDMYGKGKNQGRTLVYDLAILINSLKHESRFPKFLVHDGIFDGMDKSHFISTYEMIEEYAKAGNKIQYITTINEEGTLNDKFGNSDLLTPEVIEKKSIVVLTPRRKLLGKDF
ncbi:MAG: DUF2326 domain-containing protein [Crocinitomicaceae bacterium]